MTYHSPKGEAPTSRQRERTALRKLAGTDDLAAQKALWELGWKGIRVKDRWVDLEKKFGRKRR